MESFPVGRALPYDYLVFVNGAALLFNIYLLQGRRWREAAVFSLAAAINLGLEVFLIASGKRFFEPDCWVLRIGTVACLAWSDNGFFASIAYANIRHWHVTIHSRRFIAGLNVLYFLVLPLLSLPYGFFPGTVRTWRSMPASALYAEPLLLLALALIIRQMGYRRLLWRLLLIGIMMDAGFEARLFLCGIRPLASASGLAVLVRTVCEFNIALCSGFLLFKLLFKLDSYRDEIAPP